MMKKEKILITVLKDAMYEISIERWGKMRHEILRRKEFPETFRMVGDVLFLDVNGTRRPALIRKIVNQ